jgi:hypothetical protein
MSYHAVDRWGSDEEEPSETRMRELIAELAVKDPEHPDTWLTHESGWTLAVHETGLVVWENLEEDVESRHLVHVPRETALQLWLKLSRGEIEVVEREPWSPGQSPPISDDEKAARAKQVEETRLVIFRTFYDKLGPERPEVPCRTPGCTRGAIRLSVRCRVHHFESIYKQPCPFDD